MAGAANSPIKTFYEAISRYTQPEELFGDLGATPEQQMDHLEAAFRSLMKLYHPDRYATQPAELKTVTEITKHINELKQQAAVKIKSNGYGGAKAGGSTSTIRTAAYEYTVTELLVEGSLADIYHAYAAGRGGPGQPKKEVVIKVIADAGFNWLVDQETSFYRTMTHFCFPGYIESLRMADGRKAVALEYIADGYDLVELTRRYREESAAMDLPQAMGLPQEPGLPQGHMVWILDRFLCALGLLHQNNILHGNIQPDNLMIQPKNHNGLLIDFLHCRIRPEPDEVFAVTNPAYCAPEVLTGRFKPHPVSDIYALGRCMIEMLGGSGNSLDDEIALHPALRGLLQKMLLPNPAKRAADAWALAGELKAIRQQIYGKQHPFFPLDIGGTNGRR